MSKTLTTGPSGTPVEGLPALTFALTPLNYDADFSVIEEGPGKIVMTDLTSPQDQPSTIRVSQSSRPNVYAGTSIDPSAFLANRRGCDTVVELKEVHAITDSTDPAFLELVPFRVAITINTATSSLITDAVVEAGVKRCVAALFAQGDATPADGINKLLHGVVRRD